MRWNRTISFKAATDLQHVYVTKAVMYSTAVFVRYEGMTRPLQFRVTSSWRFRGWGGENDCNFFFYLTTQNVSALSKYFWKCLGYWLPPLVAGPATIEYTVHLIFTINWWMIQVVLNAINKILLFQFGFHFSKATMLPA